MNIDIHDVGHGACAVITSPSGRLTMIDAGHSTDPLWRPSDHYAGKPVHLIISNLDNDHVSDLHRLLDRASVQTLSVNPTIPGIALDAIKRFKNAGPFPPGLAKLIQLMRARSFDAASVVERSFALRHYYNRFPKFSNTNNLSLVTIVDFGDLRVLFSGDMENDGWSALLTQPAFANDLQGVHVFVASHHGREGGCSEDLFRRFRPEVVVISDKGIIHETQQGTANWYASRVGGVSDDAAPGKRRYVYTTRSDGHINLKRTAEGWRIFATPRPKPPLDLKRLFRSPIKPSPSAFAATFADIMAARSSMPPSFGVSLYESLLPPRFGKPRTAMEELLESFGKPRGPR